MMRFIRKLNFALLLEHPVPTSLLKNKVVINSSFPPPPFVLTRNLCLRHHVRSWNSFLRHARNAIKCHSYCDKLHASNLFDRFAVRRPNEEFHNCAQCVLHVLFFRNVFNKINFFSRNRVLCMTSPQSSTLYSTRRVRNYLKGAALSTQSNNYTALIIT